MHFRGSCVRCWNVEHKADGLLQLKIARRQAHQVQLRPV